MDQHSAILIVVSQSHHYSLVVRLRILVLKYLFSLKEYDIFTKSQPTKIHSKSSFDIAKSNCLNMYNLVDNIDMVFPQDGLNVLLDMNKFKRGLHELRRIRNQELHFATFIDSNYQFIGKFREKQNKKVNNKKIIQEINEEEDISLQSFHNLKSFLKKEVESKNY